MIIPLPKNIINSLQSLEWVLLLEENIHISNNLDIEAIEDLAKKKEE